MKGTDHPISRDIARIGYLGYCESPSRFWLLYNPDWRSSPSDQYASSPTAFLHCSLSCGRPYGNGVFHSASWSFFGTNVIGSWLCHQLVTLYPSAGQRTVQYPFSKYSSFFFLASSSIHSNGL